MFSKLFFMYKIASSFYEKLAFNEYMAKAIQDPRFASLEYQKISRAISDMTNFLRNPPPNVNPTVINEVKARLANNKKQLSQLHNILTHNHGYSNELLYELRNPTKPAVKTTMAPASTAGAQVMRPNTSGPAGTPLTPRPPAGPNPNTASPVAARNAANVTRKAPGRIVAPEANAIKPFYKSTRFWKGLGIGGLIGGLGYAAFSRKKD
ncbi:MAG: hypothetical protein ABIM30_00695 [candidate division WOR-3 bacterium]